VWKDEKGISAKVGMIVSAAISLDSEGNEFTEYSITCVKNDLTRESNSNPYRNIKLENIISVID